MAEFTLRPKAVSDLEGIWEYSAENWSQAQAERYIRTLNQTFFKLAESPDLGRRCDDIRPGYWKYGIGRHVIFYRSVDAGVDVVRILHQRMDTEGRL